MRLAGSAVPQEIRNNRKCIGQRICFKQLSLPCIGGYYSYNETGFGKQILESYEQRKKIQYVKYPIDYNIEAVRRLFAVR